MTKADVNEIRQCAAVIMQSDEMENVRADALIVTGHHFAETDAPELYAKLTTAQADI
ncbi:hypothetical protein JK361_25210 [Streptomyces sp. 5-8]|uniref:Uncharacterized protein n=1 Tax=Streptomyces musisoli TaxID=2802280 RepID=A0ABS1P6R8_9ACTN|nr:MULTISPECIES: hypothetical protein [Streptomyces]MBL1107850.1 hypothetical protein [Streptomyces musisoli]MBY8843111.1 hypothetical protein [Streptomyces sp. SP2-10]